MAFLYTLQTHCAKEELSLNVSAIRAVEYQEVTVTSQLVNDQIYNTLVYTGTDSWD